MPRRPAAGPPGIRRVSGRRPAGAVIRALRRTPRPALLRAVKASDFFALPASLAPFAAAFPAEAAPWEWLKHIGPALAAHKFDQPVPKGPPGVHVEGFVYLHPTVSLPHTATIIGP